MNAALSGIEVGDTTQIFDEIQNLHQYEVVVEFRGLWRKGMSYTSLEQAIACSRDAWNRSQLRTQVRNSDGVVFAKFPEA
ncbi:MAG: hypothetical protein H8E37_05405 [Planctomycetes bacterium]|nr:hypothetical protein [Planctomycetota bacterium]